MSCVLLGKKIGSTELDSGIALKEVFLVQWAALKIVATDG
jgi:hypothetical protein